LQSTALLGAVKERVRCRHDGVAHGTEVLRNWIQPKI
jgi:hypothetical protein